jgi:hypothetical protein
MCLCCEDEVPSPHLYDPQKVKRKPSWSTCKLQMPWSWLLENQIAGHQSLQDPSKKKLWILQISLFFWRTSAAARRKLRANVCAVWATFLHFHVCSLARSCPHLLRFLRQDDSVRTRSPKLSKREGCAWDFFFFFSHETCATWYRGVGRVDSLIFFFEQYVDSLIANCHTAMILNMTDHVA